MLNKNWRAMSSQRLLLPVNLFGLRYVSTLSCTFDLLPLLATSYKTFSLQASALLALPIFFAYRILVSLFWWVSYLTLIIFIEILDLQTMERSHVIVYCSTKAKTPVKHPHHHGRRKTKKGHSHVEKWKFIVPRAQNSWGTLTFFWLRMNIFVSFFPLNTCHA